MPHLGKHELFEPLGRGGFGVVYRARDTALNVGRAVKVLHPALTADPEFLERFRREAQVAARLEHPNDGLLYRYHCGSNNYEMMASVIVTPPRRETGRGTASG